MSKNDYSLVIMKSDFIKLNLFSLLEELLKKNNLVVTSKFRILMNINFVKQFYQWGEIKYPKKIKSYLCTKPMPVWIVQGDNAIIKILKIKNFLRLYYSKNRLYTLIHCPDTSLDFKREYKLLKQRKKAMKTKTKNQVEVIVFKKTANIIKFLMLKRNAKKGSFWQPITGNVECNETFKQAAVRELYEETGIKEYLRLFDTGYFFEFFDDNRQQFEKVFAVEISSTTKVVLSEEHTDMQWATQEGCLDKYLKYPGNKKGLKILSQILEDEKNE
jgi:dihydroneopterin triphosphate diphosphatase